MQNIPVTLALFDVKDSEYSNLQKFGIYKEELAIGLDQDDRRYLFFDEVPLSNTVEFDISDINKRITQTAEMLLKECKENTEKLLTLEYLKEIHEK